MNSINGKARRENAGRRLARKREQLATMIGEMKTIAVQDAHDGVPETVIALDLGVSRMTVRRWIGK